MEANRQDGQMGHTLEAAGYTASQSKAQTPVESWDFQFSAMVDKVFPVCYLNIFITI